MFVFGDNDLRQGYGGQAREMRGESNAVGIRVKKSPSMNDTAFYSDEEYPDNIRKICEDIDKLERTSGSIVFPSSGVGMGFAQLNMRAPITFKYLCEELYKRFGISNIEKGII
jgi:hypothetical protein